MKLRNLIFALFLAIGAIGFTACTGDDGAQGPKGDQGEQGEKGESGEVGEGADVDTRVFYYPFLSTWGAGQDGGVACSDPIIDGDGVFPGPDSLTDLTMAQTAMPANAPVGVACTGIVSVNHDPDGDGPLGKIFGEDLTAGSLIFAKSARYTAEAETVDNTPETLDNPTRTVTNKSFVGGAIYAELDDTGANVTGESFYRGRLHNTCGGSTVPPNIAGEWRGVQLTKTTHDRTGSSATGFLNVTTPDTMVVETTTKVCVKLDAHPGSVKCYIRVDTSSPDGNDDDVDRDESTVETVGLYNPDGTVTPVAPMAVAEANGDMLVAPTTPDDSETMFGADSGVMITNAKLCNLLLQ